MPFCSNCGKEIENNARFCSGCGSPQNTTQADNQGQRKIKFEGEIHKCPNCGEILDSFILNCPICGYELRSSNSISSIKELSSKLEQLEEKRPIKKIKNIFYTGLSGGQLTNIDEQKVSLIKNFSIPNTKEDVLEFFILASSNIDIKLYGLEYHSSQIQGWIVASQKAVSDAWLSKLEQAYQKAHILFGETQEFKNVQALYERKMKEIKRKKWQLPMLFVGIFGSVFLMLGLLALMSS